MFNFLKFVLKTIFGTVLVVATLIVIAMALATTAVTEETPEHEKKEFVYKTDNS